jgi:multidrug efflux pump subunit AcrB
VALGVSMAKGGDIIALGKALQKEVKALQAELPVGVTLAQIQNQPEAVATRSTSSSMC